MTETMTLTDAAESLGVHYMTAYRYVRTGRLAAVKEGGEWRVSATDLEAFSDAAPALPRTDVVPPMLVDRLIAGDESGAFQILESAMASGAGTEEIYLDILASAMTIVGERWHDGELSVAQEHVASAAALRVVARLGARVSHRGRTRGTILLASVSGDFHFLPTALIRDLLRSRGFAVLDLGANTPVESMVEMSQSIGDDLLAIGLSCSLPNMEDEIRSTIATLNKEIEVPIVVGGGAFAHARDTQSFGDCVRSGSGREALDIFEGIHTEARAR